MDWRVNSTGTALAYFGTIKERFEEQHADAEVQYLDVGMNEIVDKLIAGVIAGMALREAGASRKGIETVGLFGRMASLKVWSRSEVTAFFVIFVVAVGGLWAFTSCGSEATVAAGQPRILFIGSQNSNELNAFLELGYAPEVVAPRAEELSRLNFFSYSTIVLGSLANRNVLAAESVRTPLFQAIERGAVFVAFRSYGGGLAPVQDEWLPSQAIKDGAYLVGAILEADHPIFTTPHKITLDMLRRVHSGVMYHPYVQLGEGWIPLVAGDELMPFFRNETGIPPFHGETHYGIIEMLYGDGRLLLIQMIPEYQWFHNDGGRSDSVGRLFMENIVTYVVQSSRVQAAGSASVPPEYVDGALGVLLNWVERPSPPQMSLEAWEYDFKGPFTVKWDDRDVVTIRHPDVPAVEGAYAQLSRSFPVGAADGSVLLTFYLTDDYLGGVDRFFEHDREVGRAENWKEGYRFVEVEVDGVRVWEEDVLGPNPFPWPHRLRAVDITPWVQGKDEVKVTLRVVNRKSSEDPFWTDVYVSRVAVLDGIPGRQGVGEITVRDSGVFVPAIKVLDAPGERATVVLHAPDRPPIVVTLSADDLREHWIVGEPLELQAGQRVTVQVVPDSAGRGEEAVQQAYLLPEAYLARPEPPLADIRSWFTAVEPPERILLRVKGPEGVTMTAPVSQGLPFARGSFTPEEAGRLRLRGAGGEDVPVQVRPLAVWPDGSVKWALISFIGKPGEYELIIDGSSSAKGRSESEASVSSQAQGLISPLEPGRFRIDTGRLAFALDYLDGLRIEGATIDGQPVPLREMDFTFAYEDGRRLSLTYAEVRDVRLLENGGERAVLWLRGNFLNEGRRDLEFTLQWRVYKDQPLVWIDAAFTNRLGQKVELRDIRFHVRGNLGHEVGIPEGDGASVRSWSLAQGAAGETSSWAIVQPDENQFTQWLNGQLAGGGRRFPGWVTLAGDGSVHFFAGVRHFWEQYPKSVRVTADGLEFGLWAHETGQVLEVADGFQKTHELLFGWIDADQAPTVSRLLEQPYLLVADPEYLTGTGALGIVAAAAAADGYPSFRAAYEKSVDETYSRYLAKRESRREYGMQNFGDDTFEWGYGPMYTFWSNQEYDHHYGFLLQYLRSGDLRFWQIGDQAARHYRDVDVIHHSTNPLIIGAPRAHNTKHVVEQGWYPDHNLGGVAVHHAWVEGLWLHYLLTGDELTYEAARGAADWFVAQVESDRWFRGDVERGPGWTMIALIGSYRATSDEKYLRAAEVIATDVYLRQDPVRGVYSVPIDGRPSYEGGQSFMSGILARGMARYYLETGDERAARSVARFYDWLTREMRVDATRFIYKQAPGWHSPSATDQVVSLLAYGLALLDRRDDWEMVLHAAAIQANVRSLSWMPEAIAIFERLYARYVPLEIVRPGPGRVSVGREGPVDLELTLVRLDADERVEGWLEFSGVPAGMHLVPDRVFYRLDPGVRVQPFSVRISVEPTVEPKRYTLTVRDPDREALTIAVPVDVPARTTVDRFRPPIEHPWFAGLSLRVDEARSVGWEHIKVGGADRLRRTGAAEEYLIYDARGLFDFALTVYGPASQRELVERLVQISLSDDGGSTWTTVPTQIEWKGDGRGEYAEAVIRPQERYLRGDVKLKVTVREGGAPDSVHLARMEITGWL